MKSKKAKEIVNITKFMNCKFHVMRVADVLKAVELAEKEAEERAVKALEKMLRRKDTKDSIVLLMLSDFRTLLESADNE